MRIGIIGCGWLGLPLARALVARGHRVAGTTTSADKLPVLRAAGIEAHLLDLNHDISKAVRIALSACDRLFINIPPGRRYDDIETRYPEWMHRLLPLDDENTAWVFASTTGVYGNAEGLIDETYAPIPVKASGKAVFAAEQLLRVSLGKRLTVLRLAGLAGSKREPGRFLAGRRNVANGDAPVNLVHRTDVIALSIRVLEAPDSANSYNVCADAHPRRADFYPARARLLGLDPPTFLPGGATDKQIDNHLIRADFDYYFRYSDPTQFPDGTS